MRTRLASVIGGPKSQQWLQFKDSIWTHKLSIFFSLKLLPQFSFYAHLLVLKTASRWFIINSFPITIYSWDTLASTLCCVCVPWRWLGSLCPPSCSDHWTSPQGCSWESAQADNEVTSPSTASCVHIPEMLQHVPCLFPPLVLSGSGTENSKRKNVFHHKVLRCRLLNLRTLPANQPPWISPLHAVSCCVGLCVSCSLWNLQH